MPQPATAPVTGRHLIAGRWPPRRGRTFASHNPARLDEVIGVFPQAGAEEAGQAVAAARAAYPGLAAHQPHSSGPSCSTTSPSSSSARPTTSPG